MAYTTHSTRSFDGSSVWQRLSGLRINLTKRIAKYRLYRATLNELAMLSDRELADLGIGRGMIQDIAHKATYAN